MVHLIKDAERAMSEPKNADLMMKPRWCVVGITPGGIYGLVKEKWAPRTTSIFSMFSPDEEVFANSQLWKNLLLRTCTTRLWEGARQGQQVDVGWADSKLS